MGLRITTWNVNGIRNPFAYQPWNQKKTFQAMFDTLEADIVIMQETKIQRKDLRDDMVLVPGWDVHFSLPKHKKGYSGVAIYTRSAKCCPIRAEEGITGVLCPPNSTTKFRELPPDEQIGGYPKPGQLDSTVDEGTLDSEGRCVILEFPAFVLIGVYSPATRDETRTDFRMAFINAMDARIRNLVAMGRHVILAGDLNIIRDEADSAKLVDRLRKEDMTFEDFMSMPSRRFFNQLIFGGRVFGGERDEEREQPVMWDICREFHSDREGMFTCWETKKNTRPGNFGSRIDYVVVSNGIKDWFVDSNIQEGLLGSDHCPVYATLGQVVKIHGKSVHIEDIVNPPGMFHDGQRMREWTAKDLLPLSAKLIPEFDRRQSIKDMFFKKTAASASKSLPTPASAEIGDVPAAQASAAKPPVAASAADADSSGEAALSRQTSSTLPLHTSTKTQSSNATPQKREANASPSSARPQKKKNKAVLAKEASKTGSNLSQSSLTGFFKPKSAATQDRGSKADARAEASSPVAHSLNASPSAREPGLGSSEQKPSSAQEEAGARENNVPSDAAAMDDVVFDPVENKESWSKLLSKRVVPRCEHNEPCISLVTKKPGVNLGRSFFICPRPLGPTGEKERGTQWRCGTFVWSSDWGKSQ